MCGRKIVKTHARKNVRRDVFAIEDGDIPLVRANYVSLSEGRISKGRFTHISPPPIPTPPDIARKVILVCLFLCSPGTEPVPGFSGVFHDSDDWSTCPPPPSRTSPRNKGLIRPC